MNKRARHRFDNALGIIGKTFITAGLLLLGLVAYQLWGTGIETQRAQNRLHREFTQLMNATSSTTQSAAPTSAPPQSSVAVPNRPNSALALLEVPTAGIADIVVEGVSSSALRHGPGHVPRTALPGEPGNSAIAGHRTTYGAPFGDLDKVAIGDDATVTTVKGKFVYEVIDIRIIKPSQTEILRPRKNKTLLTLITCNPRYSTSQRLVVIAELRSASSASSSTTTPPSSTVVPADDTSTNDTSTINTSTINTTTVDAPKIDTTTVDAGDVDVIDGWFSDHSAILPAVLLGIGLALLAYAAHRMRIALLARGRGAVKARAITYAAFAVPFLVTLFFWYRFINLLLPAST